MGCDDRLAMTLARPFRSSQSVAKPEDDVAVGVQMELAQLYSRAEQLFAILGHTLEVMQLGVGSVGHLHVDDDVRTLVVQPQPLEVGNSPPSSPAPALPQLTTYGPSTPKRQPAATN